MNVYVWLVYDWVHEFRNDRFLLCVVIQLQCMLPLCVLFCIYSVQFSVSQFSLLFSVTLFIPLSCCSAAFHCVTGLFCCNYFRNHVVTKRHMAALFKKMKIKKDLLTKKKYLPTIYLYCACSTSRLQLKLWMLINTVVAHDDTSHMNREREIRKVLDQECWLLLG